MALISDIGRKSPQMRLIICGLYIILTIGSVTMAYPFMLMVSMATAGRGDFDEYRLIPRYWISEAALFKKYLLDVLPVERPAWRHTDKIPVDKIATWFGKDHWYEPLDISEDDLKNVMETPAPQREAMSKDMNEFISCVCPLEFRSPAGLFDPDSPLALRTDFYNWLVEKYRTIDEVNRAYIDNAKIWDEIGIMVEQPHRQPGDSPREKDWREFLETRPPEKIDVFQPDVWVYAYMTGKSIPPEYQGKKDEQGRLILSAVTFDDLDGGLLGDKHREDFLRIQSPARYIKVDVRLAEKAWKKYLADRQKDTSLPLAERLPRKMADASLWCRFVQTDCPIDAMALIRPEDYWRPFLREQYDTVDKLNATYGTDYNSFAEAKLPWAVFKYDCFLKVRDSLRKTYILHNYKEVFSFITVNCDALYVTLVYVILSIAGTLTVNPLAAYAMSRFKLKETYHILIFLLATMAFPAEVCMIPSFLLIKSFPWVQILMVLGCMLGYYLSVKAIGRKVPLVVSSTIALTLTVFTAGWLVPTTATYFNIPINITLMNTFGALVLPGLANGYGIFLLKGFFDSLPMELYEAGLIEGAGELQMFWKITMPLCKPILAVMALGAFSHAYGAFMHAFLICQDPKMWTIMVFLYQFQQSHTMPMVMASLVIAAIPTLLVFIFCQNIILRGIVIPSFK